MRDLLASLASLAFIASTLLSPTNAILVSEGSQCAVKCGNVGESTAAEDLSCGDGTHSSFPGQTHKECIQCELNSTHVGSNGVSDLDALVYNLRYTTGYCIFNDSVVSSTPCITEFACGLFLEDLDHNDLALPKKGSGSYDWCDNWEDALLFRCQSCLMELGSQLTLINHLTTLSAVCKQRPEAGDRIVIDGDIFSGNVVRVGNPEAAADVSTFTPHTGLTLGAKIGITVGGLVAILIVLGCCIVWRGKRKRRAYLAKFEEKQKYTGGAMQQVPKWKQRQNELNESPQSAHSSTGTRPFQWPSPIGSKVELEKSPVSAVESVQHSWSPYISQHTSPVISQDNIPVNGQWGAVPIPKPYRRGSVGTMTGRVEDIEMSPLSANDRGQWVSQVGFVPAPAPVIRHPGHGRSTSQESIGEAL